mgnify:FL=1
MCPRALSLLIDSPHPDVWSRLVDTAFVGWPSNLEELEIAGIRPWPTPARNTRLKEASPGLK